MKFDKEETNVGAHAILVTEDNNILLQERDILPGLINSGLISMFGGTIKSNEDVTAGLKRELREELKLDLSEKKIEKLGTYKKTKKIDGVEWTVNVFIVSHIKPQELILTEGRSIVSTNAKDVLKNKKLTRVTRLAIKDYLNKIKNYL